MKGLCNVIVRAQLEALDFHFPLCFGSDQSDWNIAYAGVGLQRSAQLCTRHLWHHHVGKDKVGRALAHARQRLRSVLEGTDTELTRNEMRQKPPHLRVVFGDDHFADFVPASLANRLDFRKTYLNCFTAGPSGVRRSRMPMVLPDEEACIKAALSMCGRGIDEPKRVVRIESTLHLTECRVSEALLP